jgi:hypothetical protein
MNSRMSAAAAGSVVAERKRVMIGLRSPSRSQVSTNSRASASPMRGGPTARTRSSSTSGSNGQRTAAVRSSALLPKKCATRAASTPAAAPMARSDAPS